VSLTIPRGSTLGVIGESGSGKTTLARVVAGLVDRARGEVLLDGKPLPAKLSARTLDQYRRVQIVFQNADTALNPSRTIADILVRPMSFYHGLRGAAARKRMLELLDLVKLPASIANRQPGGLSGGQKQRVNLARALAADPALILCDEVTSALDTVVGAAILDLLAELRRELGVSYMFISHDISTVRAICDEVIVLYAGQRVEAGARERAGRAAVSPVHESAGRLRARAASGLARLAPRGNGRRAARHGRGERLGRVVQFPRALPGAYRRQVQHDAACDEAAAVRRGDSLPPLGCGTEPHADVRAVAA